MASKVSVGKTAPVPLGQQPAANSLPVVFAEDQKPIPVEEQNLVKSEVALSLLGIPRAEVALGIFADVNTYDVNPTEWATVPLDPKTNDQGVTLNGIEHIPYAALFVFMRLTGSGPGHSSRHGLLGRKALSGRIVTSCANGSRVVETTVR